MNTKIDREKLWIYTWLWKSYFLIFLHTKIQKKIQKKIRNILHGQKISLNVIKHFLKGNWHLFYIITKKSSSKHMKISKEFDFNYITPFNYKRSILFTNQPRPRKTKTALSVYFFVRFLTKKYNLVLKINMNKLQ